MVCVEKRKRSTLCAVKRKDHARSLPPQCWRTMRILLPLFSCRHPLMLLLPLDMMPVA